MLLGKDCQKGGIQTFSHVDQKLILGVSSRKWFSKCFKNSNVTASLGSTIIPQLLNSEGLHSILTYSVLKCLSNTLVYDIIYINMQNLTCLNFRKLNKYFGCMLNINYFYLSVFDKQMPSPRPHSLHSAFIFWIICPVFVGRRKLKVVTGCHLLGKQNNRCKTGLA